MRYILISFFISTLILPLMAQTELLPGEISGWNILSDNEENAREVIDAASEYDINHLQISHHIVHYLREIKRDEKRELCNKLIDYAHEKGISEVLVWDHALYSLDYYPNEFRTGPDSTLDLDNQEFWEWLKNDYRLMLDLIPNVDGIILTFIETGSRTENQYSEIMKTPAEKLARVIDEIADVVINERKLKLYARTFMYTREELSDMLSCIDYINNEDVLLMVKEVPHDFYLTHPLQTFLDEIKRPVIIEFDAGHEYSGQGIIANTFVEKLTERWRFYQQKNNVIGYVARTDRFGDTKIINRPSEILLYAISALNHDPGISDDQIYRDFIGMKYGEEAIDHIKPAFENAYDIVTSTLYTLGLCMANHSTLSCDYTSTYNRFVSGRWMDNPTVFIEHGINKEFHYYKDIVNHLAPKHLKELDARLFEEDPFLLDRSWIEAEELLTREYLDYIVTEKDFGVSLAEKSLNSIEEGYPFIAEQSYTDLYNTFYRTLVKAQLSRGAAKAYFAYRLWFADKNGHDQQLLDVFWEGIDEMNQMTNIVQTKFDNSPRGGWTWEEDIATVKKYNRLMTGSGWNDYGGIPIPGRILEGP